jgi:hypothetical protein
MYRRIWWQYDQQRISKDLEGGNSGLFQGVIPALAQTGENHGKTQATGNMTKIRVGNLPE